MSTKITMFETPTETMAEISCLLHVGADQHDNDNRSNEPIKEQTARVVEEKLYKKAFSQKS